MSFDKNTGKILKKKDANGIEAVTVMMMEEKAENKWWVNEYLVRKIKRKWIIRSWMLPDW